MTREEIVAHMNVMGENAVKMDEVMMYVMTRKDCEVVMAAAELLKAQEPRVMTLEEVKAFEWDYCYLEQERQPGKEYRMIAGDYALTCITWPSITSMRIEHGDNSYGVKWRCWTSRPDEKTREATPWDAQSQREYEAAVEMAEYCERYEPTYNADDGSM